MQLRRNLLMMLKGAEDVKLYKTYVVQESWETDTKGNPVSIANAIMSNEERLQFNYNDYLIFVFENNANTSSYKAIYSICPARDNYGFVFRGTGQFRSMATGTSFYASIGTIVKIYKGSINDIA